MPYDQTPEIVAAHAAMLEAQNALQAARVETHTARAQSDQLSREFETAAKAQAIARGRSDEALLVTRTAAAAETQASETVDARLRTLEALVMAYEAGKRNAVAHVGSPPVNKPLLIVCADRVAATLMRQNLRLPETDVRVMHPDQALHGLRFRAVIVQPDVYEHLKQLGQAGRTPQANEVRDWIANAMNRCVGPNS